MEYILTREESFRLVRQMDPRHHLINIYSGIRSRCYNSNTKAFPRYGGRGIVICKYWKDDRESFIEWALKNQYEVGRTIHRLNNDGNYCPENCMFLSKSFHAKLHALKMFNDFNMLND